MAADLTVAIFASRDYKFAIGSYAFEIGNFKFAIGNYALEIGNFKFAIGSYAFEIGNYMLAIGSYAFAISESACSSRSLLSPSLSTASWMRSAVTSSNE